MLYITVKDVTVTTGEKTSIIVQFKVYILVYSAKYFLVFFVIIPKI